jgi:hypothetical protein
LAKDIPRRRLVIMQGLILGLALTVGGGAWLGINWSNLIELPIVVPVEMPETSAKAPEGSSLDAVEALGEGLAAGLQEMSTGSSSLQIPLATSELSTDGMREAAFPAWEATASLTPNFTELSGFSYTSFPGEVLLRALLVEFQRDSQQRRTSSKATLANVASGFGLEMLPVRLDINRLKRFRIACVIESSPANMSEPTFLIVRGISREGVELTDASGEIKQLKDAEFSKSWSGQAYLFHRRGLELKRVLSWGKQTPEVRMLQQRLSELGYMQATPSGLFDEDTAEAVRQLQKDHALQADGAAGPATKIVLYHLIGRSLAEVRQE